MAQGRVYTVQFAAVAATAQQDFFEFVAAAAKPLRLLSLTLSQETEVGDAAEEMLRVAIKRGQTTSGSGGSAPTPVPMNATDAAAGFTAEANNTTKASAGTIVTLHTEAWNVRMPLVYMPTPDMQPELVGGGRMTVELLTTPADSITISGVAYLEEVG